MWDNRDENDPMRIAEEAWERQAAEEYDRAYIEKEKKERELENYLNDCHIENRAADAGMTRDAYENAELKKFLALFSFLFGPGLLGILAQKILHSVSSSTLLPILILLTLGFATYTAWFTGKWLKNNLEIKNIWIFLISTVIFLFIPLFVYVLFYRYELYNSISGVVLGSFVILTLLYGIFSILYKMVSPIVKGVVNIVSPRPNLAATSQPKTRPSSHLKSISSLVYAGIIMALAVQFARVNAWSFPFFKSYEDAFATSFFFTACGVAHTAYIWQNGYVGFGLFLTTIGGFAWKYKWILPVIKTYEIPLYVGIFIILYGIVPQLLGAIFIISGSLLLTVELWLIFTKGLAAIHYGNLLASVILLGLSILMFRRQKSLEKVGVFRFHKQHIQGYTNKD